MDGDERSGVAADLPAHASQLPLVARDKQGEREGGAYVVALFVSDLGEREGSAWP